ncbi:MAG: response regulator transcription factor [Verrucomicrobiota bacterium]
MTDSKPPINVWLVEDHKNYAERLMKALNRIEGLQCSRRFSSCEDALAAIALKDIPDVILLDVELPGMSGIDALPVFRSQTPTTNTVILTVFEEDDKIFRAICAGATGYILKTSSAQAIGDAVRTAHSGGSPINPHIAKRVLAMLSKPPSQKSDYGLTPRETQILQLLVDGSTIKGAAAQLGIGYYTADEYIRKVYEKLHVHSRGGAIAKALNENLLPPKAT